MKKVFSVLGILCFISLSATGQSEINIYKDAEDYFSGKIDFQQLNRKYGSLEGNNFFKKENNEKDSLKLFSDDDKKFISSSIAKSALSSKITPYADGLSSFLVSRAKKELSISFFNGFKAQMSKEKYLDYQILFANTYEELKLVDEKIYDFQPYMQTLKKKFKEDLDTVATSFQKIVKSDSTQIGKFLNKKENVKIPIYAIVDLTVGLDKKEHIGSILENMHYEVQSQSSKGANFRNSLDLFRVLSLALRAEKGSDEYYISQEKINSLIEKQDFLRVFLGLTAAVAKQENKEIKFSSSIFNDLNSKSNEIFVFKNILKSYREGVILLNNKSDSDSIQLNNYFKGCSKLLGTLTLLNGFNKTKDSREIKSLILSLIKGSEMIYSLKTKEYTRAVNLFSSIVLNSGFVGKSGKVARFIGKYGVFMGQIADAKTSEQVQETLEYFAAPVGSWRDKSRDKFSMAIDSYVGLGLRSGPDSTRTFVSTPVGLSFNFSPLKNNSIGLSLLTSFIDLGAITSFRFKDNSTILAPIYLKQIVAPGAFLSVHHKRTPVFLNIGYQKSSSINSINSNGNSNQLTSNWRLSGSLNVNIPITYIIKR